MSFKKIAFASVLALAASQASAAVVDFEDLAAWDGTETGTYDSPLLSGGLVFNNPGDGLGGTDDFLVLDSNSPIASANGTNTLVPNYFGSTTTVTAAGGVLFTLNSLDLADPFGFNDDPIQVTFNFSDGSSEVVEIDFLPGMQTATFNVSGLLSFDFTASGSTFGENTVQLDNIVYELDGVTPVVPEPASWAMMIAGFGLVGGAMRRRGSAKAAFAA